ncbi:MAG: NAD(P)-dependent oxidoreductase, partial [Caulobacteraceae bacterium]|nr:NAD(P)-dependent oxidoreductase [Caulobacteraceae bacterium]
MKTAFVGLGVMGFPMAGHLAEAGHPVTVFNRTAEKSARWAGIHTGRVADCVADCAAGAELLAICVGADDDVRAVVAQA